MTLPRSAIALGALLVCTLTLAACGDDDGGPTSQGATVGSTAADAATGGARSGPPDGGTGDDQPGSGEVRAPEFVLTGAVTEPAGWVLDPANCVGPEESGPPYFDHYVPGDWIRRGSGYGGGGGVTGSGDHSYELPGGMRVSLDVETDSYSGDDPVASDGSPWESWDYDVVEYTDSGERTTRITYTQLDPVEIDGETFDLYLLDQAQSDLTRASEYKVRIVFADVPTGGAAGQDRRPESAEVTFSWDAGDGELPEATVREMLSTFRLATCAQDGLTEMYERVTGVEFSTR